MVPLSVGEYMGAYACVCVVPNLVGRWAVACGEPLGFDPMLPRVHRSETQIIITPLYHTVRIDNCIPVTTVSERNALSRSKKERAERSPSLCRSLSVFLYSSFACGLVPSLFMIYRSHRVELLNVKSESKR